MKRVNENGSPLRCGAERCSDHVYARGLCQMHYQRARIRPDFVRAYQNVSPGIFAETPKPRNCAVTGCDKGIDARGLCGRHYSRFRKYGDPLAQKKYPVKRVDLPDEQSPTKLGQLLGVSRQRADQLLKPAAARARRELNEAVEKGLIQKPPHCERCLNPDQKLHGHHWDYREPLDVRWLCQKCHVAVHVLMRKQSAKAA